MICGDGTVNFISIDDMWRWTLESSREFSVASIRRVIDEKRILSVHSRTRWVKYVPIKVNVLAWKIKMDDLPTRLNISRRGIDIPCIKCPSCDCGVESSAHLFFQCDLVRQIARKIAVWWNVKYVDCISYVEWVDWLGSSRLGFKAKMMFEGTFYTLWWNIWTYRNRLMFDVKPPLKANIYDNVVSSSFDWCRFCRHHRLVLPPPLPTSCAVTATSPNGISAPICPSKRSWLWRNTGTKE
ncbi:RNA-directed DNA polymerase, eukaryota [Tanacetum coccineum]